ncbi:MAG: TlpA family protein disulfide reductase [Alphaproteobacteria bacterium]
MTFDFKAVVKNFIYLGQKNLLYVGLACVLILSFILDFVAERASVNYLERQAMAAFSRAERVDPAVYLPEMEIAGVDGGLISIPDKKSFMIIGLWSVRCAACLGNLDSFKRLGRMWENVDADAWRVMAVSVDKPADMGAVSQFIRDYDYRGVAGYVDVSGRLYDAVKPERLPVTLIVDDKGRILYRLHGAAFWMDSHVLMFLEYLQEEKSAR